MALSEVLNADCGHQSDRLDLDHYGQGERYHTRHPLVTVTSLQLLGCYIPTLRSAFSCFVPKLSLRVPIALADLECHILEYQQQEWQYRE